MDADGAGIAVEPCDRSPAVFDLLLRLLSSNWSWGRLTIVLPDGATRQLVGRELGHAAILDTSQGSLRFDPRFRRLWLFYLAYCEAGFRSRRTDVIQLSLDKAA